MIATGRYIGEGFDDSRLATCRAMGYARGEAPLGFAEPMEERTVEYGQEALRHFREYQ
jgi:hypothetical protein